MLARSPRHFLLTVPSSLLGMEITFFKKTMPVYLPGTLSQTTSLQLIIFLIYENWGEGWFLKEIEVKILEINVEEIEKKLKEIGAEEVFEGELVSIYFDFEDRSLEKESKVLRLRQKSDTVILTYKELISQDKAKIMDEYELAVNELEPMKRIFEGIGLFPLYEFNKHRTTYKLNQTSFEIDKYPGIPAFLEIETSDLNTLNGIISEFGFSSEEVKSYSVKDVLEYYGKLGG